MTLEVVPYEAAHAEAWDAFCAGAFNATMLHTRRFLCYHGDRFEDLSLLLRDGTKLLGVFPAARSLSDPTLVVSHPGATYGGLVHQAKLGGARMMFALEAIARHYAAAGYRRLHYKPVPFIYPTIPAQDDLYALFRLGARRLRCDLASCIDLGAPRAPSQRRRRGLSKALSAVSLSSDPGHLEALWAVIAENLARKHGARPVHSVHELMLLRHRFPDQISLRVALIDGAVEAGIVLFNSINVWHAQYIAASETAYTISALDAVFDAAIRDAHQIGARYFDFGISTEQEGHLLNDGLHRFKTEFGGGGVAYEFYELQLDNNILGIPLTRQ